MDNDSNISMESLDRQRGGLLEPDESEHDVIHTSTLTRLMKDYVVTAAGHFAVGASAAAFLASGPIGWGGITVTAVVAGGIKVSANQCFNKSGLEQIIKKNCGTVAAKVFSVVGNTIILGTAGGTMTYYNISRNATCALGGMMSGILLQFLANRGMDKVKIAKDGNIRAAGNVAAGLIGGVSGAYATSAAIDGLEALLVPTNLSNLIENSTNTSNQTLQPHQLEQQVISLGSANQHSIVSGDDDGEFFDAESNFGDEIILPNA